MKFVHFFFFHQYLTFRKIFHFCLKSINFEFKTAPMTPAAGQLYPIFCVLVIHTQTHNANYDLFVMIRKNWRSQTKGDRFFRLVKNFISLSLVLFVCLFIAVALAADNVSMCPRGYRRIIWMKHNIIVTLLKIIKWNRNNKYSRGWAEGTDTPLPKNFRKIKNFHLKSVVFIIDTSAETDVF